MKELPHIILLLFILSLPHGFSQTVSEVKSDTLNYDRQLDLQEITVEHQKSARLTGISSGKILLHTDGVKSVPSLMGMPDVLKVLELTPGVQTSGEGKSNIYVRGGDPGQTLLLYAGIPVYTPGHALNVFPLFNADHLSTIELVKGGVHSSYGNFLSGAIITQPKTQLPPKTSIKGSIGLLASQATLDLKMGDSWGAYLSARKTYMNFILQPLLRLTSGQNASDQIEEMSYDFDDINATIIGQLSERNKLQIDFFGGRDKLAISENYIGMNGLMPWYNIGASASLSSQLNHKLTLEQSLIYSRFQNKLSVSLSDINVATRSTIASGGYNGKIKFPVAGLPVEGGVQYRFHQLYPQEFEKQQASLLSPDLSFGENHAHEAAVFLSTKIEPIPHLSIEPGIRYNFFHSVLSKQDTRKSFHSVDFRLFARYQLNETQFIRATAGRNTQYISKLFPSSTGLPTDFWVAASSAIRPQTGYEASAGYYWAFADGMFELSSDLYFRTMDNVAEYNQNFIENDNLLFTEKLLFGTGRAYGLELMLKKNYGKLSGWLSYTLGRSERKFDEIDNGRTFPARHDRTHDLSFTGTYTLNKHWDFSLTQIFATGNAYTAPSSWYFIGNTPVKEYGPYNGQRLPHYNRTDIGINYWFKKDNGINLSIYNIFVVRNPLYVSLKVNQVSGGEDKVTLKMKKKTLFTIMPSLSWRFKF